jgi:pimeloyl-ACP methyl ester carboxylesterase
VLVAHSYGGFVATNAATGNPNVKALVYIDGFIPDKGENLGALTARSGSCVNQSGLKPVPFNGGVDLYLRWEANPPYPGFIKCFANGVTPKKAAVLAAEQRPAAAVQFSEPSGPPAWKGIPSWSLIGTLDHVIPPALQEQMSKRAGAHITRAPGDKGPGRPPDADHTPCWTSPRSSSPRSTRPRDRPPTRRLMRSSRGSCFMPAKSDAGHGARKTNLVPLHGGLVKPRRQRSGLLDMRREIS